MLEETFRGRNTSYDIVVAHELFKLLVPGYLIVPQLGCPVGSHLLPYLVAKYLIRTHARVAQHSANRSLLCPIFDICWRYSDILNNTTLCIILFFFASDKGYKIMFWLIVFMLLIYWIDKVLLWRYSTTTMYDTNMLSRTFALWWSVPLALLACSVAFWGKRADYIQNNSTLVALPVLHLIFYITMIYVIDQFKAQPSKAMKNLPLSSLREDRPAVEQWQYYNKTPSYFNTNPIYCLRTRIFEAFDDPQVQSGRPNAKTWPKTSDRIYTPVLERDSSNQLQVPPVCLPFVQGMQHLICKEPGRQTFGLYKRQS
jgi:hypothetical protein